MLIVLAVVSLLVAGFAWWLVRHGRAPRAALWLGPGVLVSSAVLGGLAWARLDAALAAADAAHPADRQAFLHHDLVTVMTLIAVASAIALLAAIVLGACWLRSTPRAYPDPAP